LFINERCIRKKSELSFLRMQESPIHAGYEIPAFAGMTR